MKKIYSLVLAAIVALSVTSCSNDDPKDDTIFPTTTTANDPFDKWLEANYTYPYNVDFKYKMEDVYSDMKYHLVPADSAKSAKLAIITKFLWFDAYAECVGPDFVKSNVPRIIHLIGSPAYNSGQGTMVLGTAEGGLIVTLYMVNKLTNQMLTDYDTMNEYYFHTMHHEFTHILNQKKPYSENFQHITESGYISGDWYRKNQRMANTQGFVTPYAMSEAREDFAEMLSVYVTTPPSGWQKIMTTAGKKGAPLIQAKLDIVRNYMKESWNLDIDQLRDIVIRRASELNSLNLNELK
ncbi:MAG: putative zinc-binding metallopeptidase [Segatella oulorum]|uniref:zinc-binding metallopeptidase n=1 Tax=Segatella oulorum TaxID=28136 RepID=UPI0036231B57